MVSQARYPRGYTGMDATASRLTGLTGSIGLTDWRLVLAGPPHTVVL